MSQDSQSSGQDLKAGPPEYDAGVLTTQPRHLVPILIHFTIQHHIHSGSSSLAKQNKCAKVCYDGEHVIHVQFLLFKILQWPLYQFTAGTDVFFFLT
jgi:hypothetical protein